MTTMTGTPSPSREAEKTKKSWWRYALAFLVGVLAIFVILQVAKSNSLLCSSFQTSAGFASVVTTHRASELSEASQKELHQQDGPLNRSKQSGEDIARTILTRAYNQTFVHLVDSCDAGKPLMACAHDIVEAKEKLIRKEKAERRAAGDGHSLSMEPEERDKDAPGRPEWWFATMMRGLTEGEVHGSWHRLASLDPPLSFCTIEKVATTQWRRVFVRLKCSNCTDTDAVANVKPPACPFQTERCFGDDWEALQSMSKESVVMLRDPLERFLSAFLNKCEGSLGDRTWCKPTVLFEKFSNKNPLLAAMTKQEMFSAYVDIAPLHWDLHFFPQALYCNGLFRTIDNYDFVGRMDREFFQNLDKLARFADKRSSVKHKMRDVLRHVFDTKWEQTNSGDPNEKKFQNQGTETKAPSHVLEYYTPRTVRRVLEYTALDYLKLDLPLPRWALDMLEQDKTI